MSGAWDLTEIAVASWLLGGDRAARTFEAWQTAALNLHKKILPRLQEPVGAAQGLPRPVASGNAVEREFCCMSGPWEGDRNCYGLSDALPVKWVVRRKSKALEQEKKHLQWSQTLPLVPSLTKDYLIIFNLYIMLILYTNIYIYIIRCYNFIFKI